MSEGRRDEVMEGEMERWWGKGGNVNKVKKDSQGER